MAVNAQTAYAEMVTRRVAPLLRSAGYRGTAGTWILKAATGDAAIVNLQKSRWNTAEEVAFTVNLAILPTPWLEWDQHRGLIEPRSKLREYHGLWRQRLNPSPGKSTDREFWVVHDEATAEVSGRDVAEQLQQIGLPRLNALLDRSELIRAIRAGDFGYIKMSPQPPLAAMLSESGASQELDETLRDLENVPGWSGWELKDKFVEWVRRRAREHDPIAQRRRGRGADRMSGRQNS